MLGKITLSVWIVFIIVKTDTFASFDVFVHFSTFVQVGESSNNVGNATTELFGTYLNFSIRECVKRCQLMKACDIVNYHFGSYTCFIVRHSDTTKAVVTVYSRGYAVGIKSEWSNTVDTQCGACAVNEVCSLNNESTCSPTACGAPATQDHVVVYGNRRTTGSTAVVSCAPNCKATLGARHTITCLKNGSWSAITLTCEPVTTTTTTSTTTSMTTTPTTTTTEPTTTTPTTTTPTTTTTTPTTTTTTTTTTTPTTTTTTPTTTTTEPTTTTPTTTTTTTTTEPTTTEPTTTTTTSTTTTTPTTTTPVVTTPETFSCHSDTDVFKTVMLSDNTQITYSLVTRKKSASGAAAHCSTYGGSLFQITSIARFDFVSTFVQCSAFNDDDYWIDARWNDNSKKYFTSDGQPIPTGDRIWSDDSGNICVRIEGDRGKLNDRRCSAKYYFICEH